MILLLCFPVVKTSCYSLTWKDGSNGEDKFLRDNKLHKNLKKKKKKINNMMQVKITLKMVTNGLHQGSFIYSTFITFTTNKLE